MQNGNQDELTMGYCYIENSNIYRAARRDLTSDAILCFGVGNRISNNAIYDLPAQAILVNGNYNLIEYNDIYNVLKTRKDGGFIYIRGKLKNRGNITRHNFMHDAIPNDEIKTQGIGGYYADGGSSGNDLYGNVFKDIDDAAMGLASTYVHAGRDNDIYNNVYINTKASVRTVDGSNTASHKPERQMHQRDAEEFSYREGPWKSQFPELASLTPEDIGLYMPYNNNTYNNILINSGTVTNLGAMYGEAGGRIDGNLMFSSDPGFVNPKKDNFSFSEDSIVFLQNPNFRNIQMYMMGLYKGQYRGELLHIGKFLPLYPEDGSDAVQLDKNMIAWTYASGADYYRLEVATDIEFNNVIIDEVIKGRRTAQTYAYWEDLSKLQYGINTYFWRVTAGSKAKGLKQVSKIGPFTFKTTESEFLIKNDMIRLISLAKEKISKSVEGNNAGNYAIGSKDELSTAIKIAEDVLNEKLLQVDFDKKVAEFKKAIEQFDIMLITESPKKTLINEWLNDTKGWWDLGRATKYSYLHKDKFKVFWNTDGSMSFYDPDSVPSITGYIRRFMQYDEIIDTNVKIDFADKKGSFQFVLMMGAFDLGGKIPSWDMNTGYRITVNADGSGDLRKSNNKDYGVLSTFPAGTVQNGIIHRMQFGAVKVSGCINVIWTIDGKSIINHKDIVDPVLSNGYFMIIDNITKNAPVTTNGETKVTLLPINE